MHQAPRIHSIALAIVAAAVLALPLAANAFDPFLVTPDAEALRQARSYQYANMGADQALADLRSRGVRFQQVQSPVPGVATPIRLTGPLHGVHIHSALPEASRQDTPFEICDARLALALDDFAAILQGHDIDELIHYSMYRPGPSRPPVARSHPVSPLPALTNPTTAPPVTSSARRQAGQAAPASSGSTSLLPMQSPSPNNPDASPVPTASRHPAGLAIDVARLHRRSGQWLSVADDFAGHIGAQTCGARVPDPADDKAKELRAIICESASNRLFTYVLTPNYNLAHRDHFHMEIKPATRWFLYH